jgi:hypothetical protein
MGPERSVDSSSPRRSDGSKASARGLIGGNETSDSAGIASDRPGGPEKVMPLVILKNAVLGANVGELFDGGLYTARGNEGSIWGNATGEETLLVTELR